MSSLLLLGLGWVTPAQAQVTLDATNTTATTISCFAGTCDIGGGAVRGSSLFHSFGDFSIAAPGITEVFFNNSVTGRIITRVTGGSISNIDGTIEAMNGTPDFFLINPSGVMFGPNAQLINIGSFVASTADSLIFPGYQFSATSPTAVPPVLVMSVPMGLQFGSSAAPIQVQPGTGLFLDPGHTLALVGGEITVQGGDLIVDNGRIELGSVAANSRVNFNPTNLALDYSQVSAFQDIRLSQFAAAIVPGGDIQVQGRNVVLTEGASLAVPPSGTQSGGLLQISGSESVQLSGTSGSPFNIPTGLFAQTSSERNAGNITISTPGRFVIQEGALVFASTEDLGRGGDIQVNAAQVELSGVDPASGRSSGLFSQSFALLSNPKTNVGNGGNIDINAEHFGVRDGAAVSTITTTEGRGGSLKVNATQAVEIGGRAATGQISRLATQTFGIGDAGDLSIETNRFTVRDGVQVTVRSEDLNAARAGNAGTLKVDANQIRLDNQATLSAETDSAAGGRIKLQGTDLVLDNNSAISAATVDGQAGTVDVVAAGTVSLSGNSQISSAATGRGAAGSVSLGAERLDVRDGARATVSSRGAGDAGDLTVMTGVVTLDNEGALVAETVSGSGGNVRLQGLRSLNLNNNSQISSSTRDGQGGTVSATVGGTVSLRDGSGLLATAMGNGLAGSIDLRTTGDLSLDNGSHLSSESAGRGSSGSIDASVSGNVRVGRGSRISSASTGRGSAGSVRLSIGGDLEVRQDSQVTVSSTGTGNAGNLEAEAGNIFLTDRGRLIAETAGGEGGNIDLKVRDDIVLRFNSEISTEARGTGKGGNISLEAGGFILGVLSENSDIVANAFQGRGGSIFARAEGIFGFRLFQGRRTPESDFVASSALGIDGMVTLDVRDFQADGLPSPSLAEAEVSQGCRPRRQAAIDRAGSSRFVETGRGGMVANPTQALGGTRVRVSWVMVAAGSVGDGRAAVEPTQIVEATRWERLPNGDILLLAQSCH